MKHTASTGSAKAIEKKAIYARIVADSVSPAGVRLTTMECQFPRFILAQVNTHRAFSRNSASSRAIPIRNRIHEVETDPYIPIHMGANQSGMQAGPALSIQRRWDAEIAWKSGCANAIYAARKMAEAGVHKEVVNRLLEPFLWHRAIISATEWQNFFDQRANHDAQPEIQKLAREMHYAISTSNPLPVAYGDWHLPYISAEELASLPVYSCMAISVARCARVSYLTHEGVRSVDRDMELYDKLRSAKPPHLSPFEHVATPSKDTVPGNFRLWKQFRHTISECQETGVLE